MERTRDGWLGSTKGEHKRMVYYGSMIDTLQTLGFITGIANFQHQDRHKKGKIQQEKEFRK